MAEARQADVDRAVAAARSAFGAWSATPAAERGRLLLKLADAVEERAAELARLESADTGHPIRDSTRLDVPRTAATFRYFGGMADKLEGSVIPVERGFLNYVVREPVGVVGQIVPWNFPLMFCSWKMGPALAAGNTVVLKPAELTPLTSLRMAELMAEAGFPPGVVNIVPGYGHVAGAALAAHPDVQKVSFTGSTEVGRRIVEASAGNLKRLQLELGGKGANIVFADADVAAAVNGSAFAIFHNQGQACIAGSRLILEEPIAEEFLERFLDARPEHPAGRPAGRGHRDGAAHLPRAPRPGAGLCQGGPRRGRRGPVRRPRPRRPGPGQGLLRGADGGQGRPGGAGQPRGGLRPVRDRDHLLRRGPRPWSWPTAVDYGLGGGLWTRDLSRAHRVARAIRSGMVWVNSYKRVSPGSPFGGVGDSGYGREMGFEAMHGYTDPKSVWVNVDADLPVWYPR